MGKSLEDYMNIVESGHQKEASAQTAKVDGPLLQKLATELTEEPKPGEQATPVAENQSQVVPTNAAAPAEAAGPAAAAAQGNVKPAHSTVAGADASVVAATEAVATPQVVAAGGNAAESAAGEVPAPIKPNEGVIVSAGDGAVTDASNLSKEPGAVAAAAEATQPKGPVEKSAELKRAEEIGVAMANAYVGQLEKVAQDNQYKEALALLEDRGMLEGYDIKDRG